MAKLVKPLAIVAAVAVNVIPGVGQVMSASIIAAVTTAGVSASLGFAAGTLGLGPKSPEMSGATRDRLFANVDPSAPRKLVFGRTAMATDIRYQEWTGADQEYLDQIVCVASHKVDSIDEIWLDDELAWTAAGGAQGKSVGYLAVTPVLEGGPNNTVTIGSGTKWGSARRLTGCAYVHMRFKVTGNGKKKESPYAQSIPSRMTIVGNGMPVYDPRFDSTRGGSGTMRADDQATWAFTYGGKEVGRNSANQLLTYMLGWRIRNPSNGVYKLAVGRGVPPARFDFMKAITAANGCDETVQKADGGSEPRYRTDGIFSENDDPRQVIEAFETSMNSKMRDTGGRFGLVVLSNDLGTPRLALNDSDVLGEFRWNPKGPIERKYNEIRGRFTDPRRASLFQLVDYPRYREAPIDGIERVLPFDLPLVQSPSQAQRLVKQQFARLKYQGRFETTIGPRGWALQLGDIVTLQFSSLGWGAKLFRVVEHGIRPDGACPIVLQEEHPDIYLWDRDERPAVQPVELVKYDASKAVILQLLESTELEYADGTSFEDLKPAEPGATAGGLTVEEQARIDQLDADIIEAQIRIAQAEADIDALFSSDGGAAQAISQAEAARDAAIAARDAAIAERLAAAGEADAAANYALAAKSDASTATAASGTAVQAKNDAQGAASGAATSQQLAVEARNASQGHANAALTRSETAGAHATAAGVSAAASEQSRISAAGHDDNAAGSATVAVQAATTASGHASRAETSVGIVAQISGGSVTPNPAFANWPAGQTYPVGWTNWNALYGASKPNVASMYGGNVFRVHSVGNTVNGVVPSVASLLGPGFYVMELSLALEAGSFVGAGPFVYTRTATGAHIGNPHILHLAAVPDVTGAVNYPSGWQSEPGKVLRYSWFLDFSHPDTKDLVFHYMNNGTDGKYADKIVHLHYFGLRPASTGEIAAKTALPALEATVGTQSQAIATLNETAARHETTLTTHGTQIRQTAEALTTANTNYAGLTSTVTLLGQGATGTLNPNPKLAWVEGEATPRGWTQWGAWLDLARRLDGGADQPQFVRAGAGAGINAGVQQQFSMAAGWYVIEADVALVGGSYQGSGLTIHGYGLAGLHFANEPDANGQIGATVGGRRYFSKLVRTDQVYTNWHLMVGWGGFGATAAKELFIYKAGVRKATAEEIRSGTVIPGLQNTVNAQQVTITNFSQAIGTLEGGVATLFGRAGVSVDVNGYMTGWATNNNGQYGNFVVNADHFSILKPGGGARLEWSGGHQRIYDANGVLRVRLGVW